MPPASPTNSSAALSQLQQAQGSSVTAQQAQDQANQSLGVNQQQQAVQGLRGAIQRTTSLLNNVAPSVYGRTGNSLVTDAQATRQIGNESAPIQQELSRNTQDYGNAQFDLQNLEGEADKQAGGVLSDQSSRLSYLQQIYGNLYKQEQDAATQTEAKRQFDAQLADSQANRASSAGSSFSPTLGSTNTNTAASAPAAFAKGTTPQTAVQQLFNGYNPSADKGYTEQIVLPAVARLLALNNPKQSQDVINAAANSLVYSYRKANFGE